MLSTVSQPGSSSSQTYIGGSKLAHSFQKMAADNQKSLSSSASNSQSTTQNPRVLSTYGAPAIKRTRVELRHFQMLPREGSITEGGEVSRDSQVNDESALTVQKLLINWKTTSFWRIAISSMRQLQVLARPTVKALSAAKKVCDFNVRLLVMVKVIVGASLFFESGFCGGLIGGQQCPSLQSSSISAGVGSLRSRLKMVLSGTPGSISPKQLIRSALRIVLICSRSLSPKGTSLEVLQPILSMKSWFSPAIPILSTIPGLRMTYLNGLFITKASLFDFAISLKYHFVSNCLSYFYSDPNSFFCFCFSSFTLISFKWRPLTKGHPSTTISLDGEEPKERKSLQWTENSSISKPLWSTECKCPSLNSKRAWC